MEAKKSKHSYQEDCPAVLKDFLFYMEIVKGRSAKTVQAYYWDLRTFFRFMLLHRDLVTTETTFHDIPITSVDLDFVRSITLSDVYEFLRFVADDNGNSSVTRARKLSAIKMFFKYLTTNTGQLDTNPVKDLELPAVKKRLPKHLTLEQSLEVLGSVTSETPLRDACILTFFLNCGMRLSELVGINLSDIRDNTLRIIGKGNKERMVYLNAACLDAFHAYLTERAQQQNIKDKNALFLSRRGTRITNRRVEQIVNECLRRAGLDNRGFSVHKLRHTAATLMYQHGHVDIRALKEILGHANIGTTEIYTHVSSEQLEKAADASPLAHLPARRSQTEKKEKS